MSQFDSLTAPEVNMDKVDDIIKSLDHLIYKLRNHRQIQSYELETIKTKIKDALR